MNIRMIKKRYLKLEGIQNKQNTKDIASAVAHKTQEKLDKSDTCKSKG